MSKKGRLQNRQRKAARNRGDALQELAFTSRLVGDLFGSNSQCLQAAALMVATARALGYEVEPRLVSAVGVTTQGGDVSGFVTGTVAAAAAAAVGLPEPTVEPGSNFATDWAGHAVVIFHDPPALFDANFRQFERAGFPGVSIVMKVQDVVPSAGFWQATMGTGAVVRYLPDDRDAEKHLGTIAGLAEKYASAAQALADMVRSGAEPGDASWVTAFVANQPSLRYEVP